MTPIVMKSKNWIHISLWIKWPFRYIISRWGCTFKNFSIRSKIKSISFIIWWLLPKFRWNEASKNIFSFLWIWSNTFQKLYQNLFLFYGSFLFNYLLLYNIWKLEILNKINLLFNFNFIFNLVLNFNYFHKMIAK